MFKRGNVYNNWAQQALPDECYSEAAENGCQLEVRSRENGDVVEVLVCVYAADGERVVERMESLPVAEWTVEDALQRGRDQAERIAGGESGRLPCADSGQLKAD
ncbi:hypothetical protein [Pseudomonas sp.]|jgi:hypothetical protein|uniref:hypothetical protein n=1 Tax=Pseudomonas sp. TaxID=306 RepID=UPI002ED8AC78